MKDWELTLITPETILRDALDVIGKAELQIAIVIDAYPYLLAKLIGGCSKSPSFFFSRVIPSTSASCFTPP